tara:strand:+ start:36 stop:155 length:120 start_codon:yes stop_codon:yes gene_type:complete
LLVEVAVEMVMLALVEGVVLVVIVLQLVFLYLMQLYQLQ